MKFQFHDGPIYRKTNENTNQAFAMRSKNSSKNSNSTQLLFNHQTLIALISKTLKFFQYHGVGKTSYRS